MKRGLSEYNQQDLFADIFEEKKKPDEEPKYESKPLPKPEQKRTAWVPRMINGEWEIY
jgi:hypothetical protein